MKWFTNLSIKLKGKFSKSVTDQSAEILETAKKLMSAHQYEEALLCLDSAITSNSDNDNAYKLKGECLQKMNFHYNAIEDFDKAIETNPLEFSNYYSRAVSKKAILDFTGQIEDLHNAIYYYNKSAVLKKSILRAFESDLLSAKMNIEMLAKNASEITKTPALEIRTHIKESLHLIREVKLKNVVLE
jgi:tetratricopeptide (TPR) repeat protein